MDRAGSGGWQGWWWVRGWACRGDHRAIQDPSRMQPAQELGSTQVGCLAVRLTCTAARTPQSTLPVPRGPEPGPQWPAPHLECTTGPSRPISGPARRPLPRQLASWFVSSTQLPQQLEHCRARPLQVRRRDGMLSRRPSEPLSVHCQYRRAGKLPVQLAAKTPVLPRKHCMVAATNCKLPKTIGSRCARFRPSEQSVWKRARVHVHT